MSGITDIYKLIASKVMGLFSEQLLKPAQRFFSHEAMSSVLLLAAATAAILLANSQWRTAYEHLIHTEISFGLGTIQITKSLFHWVNDGLMALFFFTVGLEIKREMMVGELSSFRRAIFPAVAAIGGMIVPAVIYGAFTHGTPYTDGWGIPMATDIAFALGAVAVFGKRLPAGLRVFLAAFAIADDMGAVMVIALFYTKTIVWMNLLICIGFIVILAIVNLLWVRHTLIYALLGLGVWISVLGSGVHPTVAGVIVSLFIPARGKLDTDLFIKNIRSHLDAFECEEQSCGFSILLNNNHLNAVQSIEIDCHNVETPLQRLEHALHPWVAFVILPLFAFCNSGLDFHGLSLSAMILHPVTLGVITGLVVGKPIGILLFAFLAVKTGLAALPRGIRWGHIFGASLLGGIGFTMSLFISELSFSAIELLDHAKFGIFAGSILAATLGIGYLYFESVRERT